MRTLFLLALAATLPLASCASPAEATAMVPHDFEITNRHPATTCVQVTGGSETNPLWTSKVADADFAKAITDAITRSQVFTAVVEAAGADCRLEVKLVELRQPAAGFDVEVTMVTEWRLFVAGGERPFAEETVSTPYLAGLGDAFVGTTRLRLANEGAGRANIREGLRRLSVLPPIAARAAATSRSMGAVP